MSCVVITTTSRAAAISEFLSVALTLYRTAGDAAHEVALQEDEHGQRKCHLQHRGGSQELPAASERRDELGDLDRERPVRAGAQERQRDEQVVPDAQEHEDRE